MQPEGAEPNGAKGPAQKTRRELTGQTPEKGPHLGPGGGGVLQVSLERDLPQRAALEHGPLVHHHLRGGSGHAFPSHPCTRLWVVKGGGTHGEGDGSQI